MAAPEAIKLVTQKDLDQMDSTADQLRRIQEFVEDVRAGKFESIAIVGIKRDGTATSAFSALENWPPLVGALEWAKFRLMKENTR